ncbi:hypothetical protein [Micromonospora gifhornensis]|uniref:hypothetical protein n=1 Tax=Micromonospora gifhornensis TaxID=84594 RepID=UPI003D74FA44
MLVRVRTASGRDHVEIRVHMLPTPTERAARQQLVGPHDDLRHAVIAGPNLERQPDD